MTSTARKGGADYRWNLPDPEMLERLLRLHLEIRAETGKAVRGVMSLQGIADQLFVTRNLVKIALQRATKNGGDDFVAVAMVAYKPIGRQEGPTLSPNAQRYYCERQTLIRHCGLNAKERAVALKSEWTEPIDDKAVTPAKLRAIDKRHRVSQQKMVWRLGHPDPKPYGEQVV